MSESYFRVIPTDPSWTPDDADAEAAKRALREVCPNAEDLAADSPDEIMFVDQGENFQAVRCPRCSQEVALEWWQDQMSEAYERAFTDLAVVTPCCLESSSLNDLEYDWPAGFARFVLSARSPGRESLTPDELTTIATALGHPVRQIVARY